MFTGIVEEIGYVGRLSTDAEQHTTLQIMCKTALEGTRIGDSIAVNGVCLTVTELEPTSFRVGVSPETLRRTNLGLLRAADPVNLERFVGIQWADGRALCTGAY